MTSINPIQAGPIQTERAFAFSNEPSDTPVTEFREFYAKLGLESYFQVVDGAEKVRVDQMRIRYIEDAAHVGTVIGAVGGGVIGGVVTAGNPVGIAGGAALGSIAGRGIGTVVGKKFLADWRLERSACYRRWRLKQIQEKTYHLFTQELRQHDHLVGLICPLSLDLPELPVRAPCGHVYEASRIMHWLKTKPKKASCCGMGAEGYRFTPKELVFDENHLIKIILALSELRSGSPPLFNESREITKSRIFIESDQKEEDSKDSASKKSNFREGIKITLKSATKIYQDKCDHDITALIKLQNSKPNDTALKERVLKEISDVMDRKLLFVDALKKELNEGTPKKPTPPKTTEPESAEKNALK